MAEVRLIAVPRSGVLPAEVGESVPPLLSEVAGVISGGPIDTAEPLND